MKKALITGASGGIGRAVSLAFAKAGYEVAAQYNKHEERALALEKAAAAEGGRLFTLRADLSSPEGVRDMKTALLSRGFEPDVIINNAGIALRRMIQDTSDEDLERVLSVNVRAPYAVVREFLPSMIDRKSGCVINISSVWGETGASCETAYSASKGAVIAMTKAMAKELAPSGIRVNCISPGCIDTEMNAELSEEDLKAICEETPLGRLGTPGDVASAALFLAGSGAAFITGQVLGVSGGFVI